MITESGNGRDANRALWRDVHFWFDDAVCEVQWGRRASSLLPEVSVYIEQRRSLANGHLRTRKPNIGRGDYQMRPVQHHLLRRMR